MILTRYEWKRTMKSAAIPRSTSKWSYLQVCVIQCNMYSHVDTCLVIRYKGASGAGLHVHKQMLSFLPLNSY